MSRIPNVNYIAAEREREIDVNNEETATPDDNLSKPKPRHLLSHRGEYRVKVRESEKRGRKVAMWSKSVKAGVERIMR